MENNIFILSLASMGGIGLLLASFLALANKKLMIEEDHRIAMIRDILPSANCGACGMPGCFNFAEGVVENKVSINSCPVGGAKTAQEIARIMGVEIEGFQRKIAKVLCQDIRRYIEHRMLTEKGVFIQLKIKHVIRLEL
jgi:electron transport complex protein RnfB